MTLEVQSEAPNYVFDVCFSFASEDRAYVDEVFHFLQQRGIRVFYDKNETVNMWGKNLYDYLSDLYKNKAQYCVMFISEHYAKKQWTNHERKSAQARAFGESEEYILPARFDNTELPGLESTVLYIPLAEMTPLQFADLIAGKVEARTAQKRPSPQSPSQQSPAQSAPESGEQSHDAGAVPSSDLFTLHPPQTSLALFKDYLAEARFRIRLSDQMVEETESLFSATLADKFPLATPISTEEVINRTQRYEVLIEPLATRLFLGCRWGEKIHEPLWVEALARISNPLSLVGAGTYMEIWDNFRLYPALLLLYTAGISCLVYGRYDNLAAIMTKPLMSDTMGGSSKPVGARLYASYVMDSGTAQALSGKQRLFTPLNDHLENLLWNMFSAEIRWHPRFASAFIRFEYLLALTHGDLDTTSWVPGGNFLWKQRRSPRDSIFTQIDEEINSLGQGMPLLQAGLFGGSVERLKEVKSEVDAVLAEMSRRMH